MKRLLLILAAIVARGASQPDSRPDELLAAVRSAAEGHAPLDPRVAGALLPGREPPAAEPSHHRSLL